MRRLRNIRHVPEQGGGTLRASPLIERRVMARPVQLLQILVGVFVILICAWLQILYYRGKLFVGSFPTHAPQRSSMSIVSGARPGRWTRQRYNLSTTAASRLAGTPAGDGIGNDDSV